MAGVTRSILDTSVLIAAELPPLEGELGISAASVAELQFGVLVTDDAEVRSERLRRLTLKTTSKSSGFDASARPAAKEKRVGEPTPGSCAYPRSLFSCPVASRSPRRGRGRGVLVAQRCPVPAPGAPCSQ